jgi:hypothetical protein
MYQSLIKFSMVGVGVIEAWPKEAFLGIKHTDMIDK